MKALVLVLLCCGCGSVHDGANAFDAGQVDEAIAAWEPALHGDSSPTALYDLGCAWYRKGDRARALAYWRAARIREPWSGTLAHNIALARSELEGVPDPVGAPLWWMNIATGAQVGFVAGLFLLVGFGLAARRGAVTAALSVSALGWLLAGVAVHGSITVRDHPISVVVESAQVRDAPRADGAWRFPLPVGSEVRQIAVHGEFVLVETGDARRGWIARNALVTAGPWVDSPTRVTD